MSDDGPPFCCDMEMQFIRALPNGNAFFRCEECHSKEVQEANLCPVCTEPCPQCVCVEMGYGPGCRPAEGSE